MSAHYVMEYLHYLWSFIPYWFATGEIVNILSWPVVFFIGMACGSYATMPYYRLPNGIPVGGKWTGHKSACTTCGATLRTRDLLPVFNWLITRGKCFNCGTKVNPMYFFIEFSCVLFALAIHWRFPVIENLDLFIILMGFATCMVMLMATDISYRKAPAAILMTAAVFALLLRMYVDGASLQPMILGFVTACVLIYGGVQLLEKIRKRPIASYDYPKLLALAGMFLPIGMIHYFAGYMLASLVAVVGLYYLKTKRLDAPYGLAICIATVATFSYAVYLGY